MIMKGMPTMNFGCLVLCLIMSIVTSIATEPPRAEMKISVFSGTR